MASQVPGVTPPHVGGNTMPGPSNTTSIPSSPVSSGVPKKASPIPLVVSVLLLVFSGLILIFQFQLGGGIWYAIGYLFTPILSSLTLGWDSILQRNGRKDPWFAPSPLVSRLIRISVGLSFVLAFFHIMAIAHLCGESFVQSGAFCV